MNFYRAALLQVVTHGRGQSVGRVKNTLAHQLALPCVYTSGWQFLFWYQRPDQIKESDPALNFWRELPTAFDETRCLQDLVCRRPQCGRHAHFHRAA